MREFVSFDHFQAFDAFLHYPNAVVYCINKETMQVALCLTCEQAHKWYKDGIRP